MVPTYTALSLSKEREKRLTIAVRSTRTETQAPVEAIAPFYSTYCGARLPVFISAPVLFLKQSGTGLGIIVMYFT